jgi:hypothetical protein
LLGDDGTGDVFAVLGRFFSVKARNSGTYWTARRAAWAKIMKHYRALPRERLQQELRTVTGIDGLYLWEYIGLQWIYEPVRADKSLATRLGVQVGDVIACRVLAGHVFGGALADLINVNASTDAAPYSDPFA